jgi:integrase/recombinase XerD
MTNLTDLKKSFLQTSRVDYQPRSITTLDENLTLFLRWCEERDITSTEQITRSLLETYPLYLFDYRKKDGKPLSYATQGCRLTAVRVFFKWLTKKNHLLYNPASELKSPKVDPLPKHILTQSEVEQVLAIPDIKTGLGIRDRAIIELLYSTAIRRQELSGLQIPDVNLADNSLRVREGKGGKDRVIPIGERAITWVDKWLSHRPDYHQIVDNQHMFITKHGQVMTAKWLTDMVRRYIRKTNIEKPGSCHLFRHSCATLMLENGADIRYIQALLGHHDLNTTQKYTQVSITQLKKVHQRTHPAKIRQTQAMLKEQIQQLKAKGRNDQQIADEFNEKGVSSSMVQQWTAIDIAKLQ